MACRTALRSALLIEACRPVHLTRSSASASFRTRGFPSPRLSGQFRTRGFHFAKRTHLNCSHNENASSLSEDEQGPPQEAVLKAISEVSKTEGRVGQTTNVVIGGTVTDDSTNEWLALDQKVNSYPTVRGFTAIGTGGDDFVQAMVVAVESVIQQPVPEGHVRQKVSSRGKYVSVNIGPVQVISSEQVQAVYNAMRRDDRMKYFL
ncbi:uncharacterized protein LOC110769470 [Prunus avium]|uniref:Uncharacterized protein n=2 Tax=Prunus TaxID=3754 RepID=A0AAD4ZPT2_PRUDU|nr:uncharacterized protein LOC110769470 [Prunus avium]KAI5351941.1 hypothetical protein L3X38_004832 [Prunus dulcis]